jgi:hypothetical protein
LPAIVEKVAELFGNVSVERFPIGAHTCPACELGELFALSLEPVKVRGVNRDALAPWTYLVYLVPVNEKRAKRARD